MYGFVFNNPLSVVYLLFCESVHVVCVHRLFFARSWFVFRAFVIRFPPVLQAFTHLYTTFNARFALAFALNENGKGTFN